MAIGQRKAPDEAAQRESTDRLDAESGVRRASEIDPSSAGDATGKSPVFREVNEFQSEHPFSGFASFME